jgi:hypothetical protein
MLDAAAHLPTAGLANFFQVAPQGGVFPPTIDPLLLSGVLGHGALELAAAKMLPEKLTLPLEPKLFTPIPLGQAPRGVGRPVWRDDGTFDSGF